MAGQHVDIAERTFTTGEAIGVHQRVKLTGDFTVKLAGAGERGIGTARVGTKSGDPLGVRLYPKNGTLVMEASGAITQNRLVYPDSGGQVTGTPRGAALGVALEAAGASGDWIEVAPLVEDVFAAGTSPGPGLAGFFDDFEHINNGDLWAFVLTDAGSITVGDAANGIVSLIPSDGTVADNDEASLRTTNELYLFAADKPLWAEARLALNEANVDDANVLFGLVSGAGANVLLNNGGGPPADYSGAVFYKIDGGTAWLAEVSIGATQTAVALTGATFPGDGTYQTLRIEFIPTSATTATVNFYVDGVLVGATTTFTYTGATEMHLITGVKNGGANNETLLIDYIGAKQVR